jgi:hypothetical protein
MNDTPTAMFEVATQDIIDDESAGVSDVHAVVRRQATNIHVQDIWLTSLQSFFLPRPRVVKPKIHRPSFPLASIGSPVSERMFGNH